MGAQDHVLQEPVLERLAREGLEPYALTVHDFHRMAEAGILDEDDRVELLYGVLTRMAPIGPRHASGVSSLSRRFSVAARGRVIVWTQNPVILSEHDEPQPDLALLRPREDEYWGALPQIEDVLLLVEVADTTLERDQRAKLPLYAARGIPEFWLFDIAGRRLSVFRDPAEGRYRTELTLGPDDSIAALALPDFVIALAEVLR
jgi:Uma2 family endonuclease